MCVFVLVLVDYVKATHRDSTSVAQHKTQGRQMEDRLWEEAGSVQNSPSLSFSQNPQLLLVVTLLF